MFPIESFRKTLLKVVEILQPLQIPFHLTGGVTSVAYGEPRLEGLRCHPQNAGFFRVFNDISLGIAGRLVGFANLLLIGVSGASSHRCRSIRTALDATDTTGAATPICSP